jgi:hypothetical protein
LLGALHELAAENFVCESPVFVNDPEKGLALYRIAEEAAPGKITLEERNGNAVLTAECTGKDVAIMQLRAEVAGGSLELREGAIICTMPLLPASGPDTRAGTA